MTHKGLIAYIYKHNGRDASNNGISAHYNEVLVVGKNIPEVFESGGRPVVELKRGTYDTIHAVPLEEFRPKDKKRGPMFGGCYIDACDSRFSRAATAILGQRVYGAIALHDRYE